MARMYRMPRRLSICNNLILICTILATVRRKWIHTDLRFSLCFWDWPRDSDDWEWGHYLLTKKVRILRLNNIALTSYVRWLSSKAAIDTNWFTEGQKELHVPAITVLSFQVFPLNRGKLKPQGKEKKAEDYTDGAIWAQTEITSDFNSWEMRWHQRNLICVIHNRKIGRNAASDRYSIFNMTVSFRSFQFFGATLCSTATSKINLYRLRDLEI